MSAQRRRLRIRTGPFRHGQAAPAFVRLTGAVE
jgi:hypothetical protein